MDNYRGQIILLGVNGDSFRISVRGVRANTSYPKMNITFKIKKSTFVITRLDFSTMAVGTFPLGISTLGILALGTFDWALGEMSFTLWVMCLE